MTRLASLWHSMSNANSGPDDSFDKMPIDSPALTSDGLVAMVDQTMDQEGDNGVAWMVVEMEESRKEGNLQVEMEAFPWEVMVAWVEKRKVANRSGHS